MQSEAKAKALLVRMALALDDLSPDETIGFSNGVQWIDVASVAEIRSAALSDKQAGEVKALEWCGDGDCYAFADVTHQSYSIAYEEGKYWANWDMALPPFDTLQAAKVAAQADYEQRIRSALVDVPVEPVATYFARQIEWSLETFGPSLRTKGVIDHIRKELAEIEREPHDLSEWIDVVILAMDGFWRHGGKADELMPALLTKQQKNMARVWPDWRTMSEDRAIEHDRSHDALPPLPHRGEDSAEVERLRDLLSRAEEYVIDGVTNAKAEAEMNAPYPARAHRYDAALAEVRQLYTDIQGALAATRSGSANISKGCADE